MVPMFSGFRAPLWRGVFRLSLGECGATLIIRHHLGTETTAGLTQTIPICIFPVWLVAPRLMVQVHYCLCSFHYLLRIQLLPGTVLLLLLLLYKPLFRRPGVFLVFSASSDHPAWLCHFTSLQAPASGSFLFHYSFRCIDCPPNSLCIFSFLNFLRFNDNHILTGPVAAEASFHEQRLFYGA